MGNDYYRICRYQKAIECYRKYLEIAEELEDKAVKAHGNMGKAYNFSGQYQKAIDCHSNNSVVWEDLSEIWEMLITALRDTKKQLTVMAKIWKLQKNLGIELELEKLTQISEILKTA